MEVTLKCFPCHARPKWFVNCKTDLVKLSLASHKFLPDVQLKVWRGMCMLSTRLPFEYNVYATEAVLAVDLKIGVQFVIDIVLHSLTDSGVMNPKEIRINALSTYSISYLTLSLYAI